MFQKCVEEGVYSSDWGGIGIEAFEVDYDWLLIRTLTFST